MLQVIAWLVANFTIPYTQLYIMCTSMYMYIIIIQDFDFSIYNFRHAAVTILVFLTLHGTVAGWAQWL